MRRNDPGLLALRAVLHLGKSNAPWSQAPGGGFRLGMEG